MALKMIYEKFKKYLGENKWTNLTKYTQIW
jgi:hypothetical protein